MVMTAPRALLSTAFVRAVRLRTHRADPARFA
jgi:hypothetical protein